MVKQQDYCLPANGCQAAYGVIDLPSKNIKIKILTLPSRSATQPVAAVVAAAAAQRTGMLSARPASVAAQLGSAAPQRTIADLQTASGASEPVTATRLPPAIQQPMYPDHSSAV